MCLKYFHIKAGLCKYALINQMSVWNVFLAGLGVADDTSVLLFAVHDVTNKQTTNNYYMEGSCCGNTGT